MEIKKTPSPNFKAGRKGRSIIAIVNHITAGLMPGTLSWLQNPAAKASAHYLVTKKGAIYQLVKDEDTAFHAGIVDHPKWPLYDNTNPNFYTLGIEHEALAGEALTEAQYQATLWLHRQLTTRWSIPLDEDHIIGHYRLDNISRKNDPGTKFPWKRLFADLNAQTEPPQPPGVIIKIGKQEIPGILIDGTSFGPVRIICEALSHQVSWDSKTNTVLIPPVNIQITASQEIKIATGNTLIAALMQGNTAYAPLRKLLPPLGHSLKWDEPTKTVFVD